MTSDTMIELTGGRYKSELFSYFVLAMPLAVVTEPFSEIRYGQRTNEPYHYLYLLKQDSLMLVLGIDPADYMVKLAEGVIYQGDDNFVFQNQFAEYQQYEGFYFPYSLVNISMGLIVGSSIVEKLEINPEFSEDYFAKGYGRESDSRQH